MIKYKQAGWHYWAGTALQLISSRLGETIMERYVARQLHKRLKMHYMTPGTIAD